MPTLLDISGSVFPEEWNNKKTIPLEGKSIVPVFSGSESEDRTLFWEHEENKAIRKGEWKLVMEYSGEWNRTGLYTGTWELYNMMEDRTETNNLANVYPEVVTELKKEWDLWAKKLR